MVQKDAPERDAAAGINAQIAAVAFQLRQRAYQWLRGGSSIMHLAVRSCIWLSRPACEHASSGTEFDKKHRRRIAGSEAGHGSYCDNDHMATLVEPPKRVMLSVDDHRSAAQRAQSAGGP
jgi:hypothetical protein